MRRQLKGDGEPRFLGFLGGGGGMELGHEAVKSFPSLACDDGRKGVGGEELPTLERGWRRSAELDEYSTST